ncbi:MAG: alanine racemase [Psychromonas sp.]|jgi:alanine racemase|uniref:alanine racemase n=1 Tax=Psychromonas sp. TaxID=1884585 RepID=UPI0039E4F78D
MIDLDHLTHNMKVLQKQAGKRPLFPAIKANAYGHDAEIIAKHLISLGYTTLCTAHLSEAAELVEKGIDATFIILSPTLAQNSDYLLDYDFQPVVCSQEQLQALAQAARKRNKKITIHVKVDTGMGRMGVKPDQILTFLDQCKSQPEIIIGGICSHFPRADENDLSFSKAQFNTFAALKKKTEKYHIPLYHIANSAALFTLTEARLDAVRPGISIYGLKPSVSMKVPGLNELKPVMSLISQITLIKEVEQGVGIGYGHMHYTDKPSLIATIPMGYGDGLSRTLSNKIDVLIAGERCRQVGRICMDQCMIDVTHLRGKVSIGDEVCIIGTQGSETITVDDVAKKQSTVNYEIITAISMRVPRIVAQ